MREALGNAFIMDIAIAIVIIIIGVVVSSFAYTKAFKVKNMIISTIEAHNGNIQTARDEIDANLSTMGYRINQNGINKGCNDDVDEKRHGKCTSLTTTGNYRYCIYKCTTSKGTYYRATSYMYFDLPVIGNNLEFPVYGETKIFYNNFN